METIKSTKYFQIKPLHITDVKEHGESESRNTISSVNKLQHLKYRLIMQFRSVTRKGDEGTGTETGSYGERTPNFKKRGSESIKE